MSFYTVIYSSLGMSASWEIHEKVVKSSKFVGFSREGAGSGLGLHFGWILGPFWEHVDAQNRKKGDPETLRKNDGKKRDVRLSGELRRTPRKGGGGP